MKIAFAVQHDLVKKNSSSDDWLIKEELEKQGIQVDVIDWRDSRIDPTKYDAVYVSSTWNAAVHCDEFVAWLKKCEADNRRRLINDREVLLFGLHKDEYLSALKEHFGELDSAQGSVTPSLFIKPTDDVHSVMQRRAEKQDESSVWNGDMVIKPVVSAIGKDTYLITRDEALLKRAGSVYRSFDDAEAIVQDLLKRPGTRGVIVQPFIPGVEESGEYQLIFIRNEFSHAIVKPKGFGNRSSAGKKELQPHELPAGMLDFAQRIMKFYATKFPDGVTRARLDFFTGAKGPILCEAEVVEPHTNIRRLSQTKQMQVISRYAQALISRTNELEVINLIERDLATTDTKQYHAMLKNADVVKAVRRICQTNREILERLALSQDDKYKAAAAAGPIYVKQCLDALHDFSQRNYQDKGKLVQALNQAKDTYVSSVLGKDRNEFSKGIRIALMTVVNAIAALSFGLAHYVHYKQTGSVLFFSAPTSELRLKEGHRELEVEIENSFVAG